MMNTLKEARPKLARVAFAVCAMAVSQSVWATAVLHTFDFRDLTSPFAMTPDGTPLLITSDNGLVASLDGVGTAACTPPCANDGRLQQGLNGVGVFDNIIGNSERVKVSIAPVVGALLQSVVFESGAGAGDTLNILVDGVLKMSYVAPTTGGTNTIDFSALNLSGSLFEFVGVDTAQLGAPAYTLTSLKVSVGSTPEPGALALFGLGLAAIPFVRKRRTPV
jgi:hypothetical protein